MFKKENGITLVALVVTIVVLLILAGVSISLVLGQNGLVNRAKDAANATNTAATSENQAFEKYDNETWFNTLVNGMD